MPAVALFKLGSLFTLFMAVLTSTFSILSREAKNMRELGLRGQKRRLALAKYGAWRTAEPPVRWLATVLGRLISDPLRKRLDSRLVQAGDPLGLEPEELVAITVVAAATGASIGAVNAWLSRGSPISIIFLSIILGILPIAHVDSLKTKRSVRIQRGLPSTVDLLCLGLSAGLDFPAAVRQIVERSAQSDDPMIEELSLILSELTLGKTRREALENFAQRHPIDAVKQFVGFVVQSEEEGNPLAMILSVQAQVSRQRRSVRAEELAAKASLAILAPVALVMLSVLILIVAPLMLNAIGSVRDGI